MAIKKSTEKQMLNSGYTMEDVLLVENSSKYVRCLFCDDNDDNFEEKIPHKKVKELIGDYNFAIGICRALRHNSAVRDIEGTSNFIYFEKKDIA